MNSDQAETAASVTINAIGYRALHRGRLWKPGRLTLRYAEAGGRPITNLEFCHGHGRLRVARDKVAGLKVWSTMIARLGKRFEC
jgi:hypothetical protein